MEPRILRLNLAGQPIEWVNWQEGVSLFARDLVSWSLGGVIRAVRGGKSKLTGQPSIITLPAIIACGGERLSPVRINPPLTNRALFQRDNYQCLYCGLSFSAEELSRDHVHPISRGGQNRWENVVAACKRCNQRKGCLLLEESNLSLLALPYRPNPYEYLALINSQRIRGDQMEYLRPQFHRYQTKSR
jgi:hypothetical protein